MTQHTQAKVFYPLGKRPDWVEVDEGMLPFLLQLWERGVQTQYSCEHEGDGSGMARIWFWEAADAAWFRSLYPDAIYAGGSTLDFPREHIFRPLRRDGSTQPQEEDRSTGSSS